MAELACSPKKRYIQAKRGKKMAFPEKDMVETVCATTLPHRLALEKDNVKKGLGRLVLALIKLLHELLERQAIRRMEGGSLSEAEIEKLGLTLMKQGEEISRLREEFGLTEDEINMDLGPLGKLL
jgi:hypothetical protein